MVHQNGTTASSAGLPALVGPRPEPSGHLRVVANADFISHLIAARQHLMPQRGRRRETPENACGAYATGAAMGIRRMPAGYRTSRMV